MNLRSMMSAAVPTSLPVEESAQQEGKGGKMTEGKDGADGDMQLQHTLLKRNCSCTSSATHHRPSHDAACSMCYHEGVEGGSNAL